MVDIRRGTTRVVFLTRRWAFKVPNPKEWRLFLHGMLANLQERKFGRGYSEALCPVRWADPLGLLVVMPRAKPMKHDIWWVSWMISGGLREPIFLQTSKEEPVFKDLDGNILPIEAKIDSFGYLDGKLVVVDYGS